MNIQTTAVRSTQTPRANRIGFGLGAGVLAGSGYLMTQLLPAPAG